MVSQNTINQRVGHRGFVTKIINSVSDLLKKLRSKGWNL